MSYCVACGKALRSEDRFCTACGKPVIQTSPGSPSPTPDPHSVGEPVTMPTHPPSPTQRRSHKIRNIALIGVAGVLVVIAVILLSGPSPKDSLENAIAAYKQQDAQVFHNYVDVQSVLNDWVDQVANNFKSDDKLIGFITEAGVAATKIYIHKIAPSVELEIINGHMSDQPQSNDSNINTNYIINNIMDYISNGIRVLVTSQLTYQGVVSRKKSGSNAVLDVQIGSSLSNSPFIVKVKMRQIGDHWRVVAIPDLAGLLDQLHPVQN